VLYTFELDLALKGKRGKLMPIGKLISVYGIPLCMNRFWKATNDIHLGVTEYLYHNTDTGCNQFTLRRRMY